jgi:Domain of unknown function (DUF4403)
MKLLRTTLALLVPALLVVVSFTACSGVTQSLTAERPRGEMSRTSLKQELSCLNVPIEATTNDFGKVLNQSIRQKLYKGSTGTRGMTADIVRNGLIAVSAADNHLYITLPISMTLGYGMFETPAMCFTLRFKATARLTPDWKLQTDIQYLGLSDLMAEETNIGPISLRPRSIVEGITQPVQQQLSDLISTRVNEMFPLKARIAEVWNAAQKSVLLDRNYNAWLQLTPREVMISPLFAQANRVWVIVGINAFAELVVGPEPAARPPVPLPALKPAATFDKHFRLALNADLFYRDLIAATSSMLLDKKFDSDGKSITIKAFDIYGNGDRLVVEVETKGSLDGVIYLTCKPGFDPRTNTFFVDDLDFDLRTESLLAQSADWLLHGAFRSMIREKLNMDLTQRLEKFRELARKAIAQVQLADHILLKGDIKTLKFNDVLVQKDRISIQVYTEGESAIYFQ